MSNPFGSKRAAPCTIFSTTNLSPRQIANKAYTLGCKKLDRDDKRSHQRYHLRERLLLYNSIAKAEEVLNARTKRTNRRVMAAEDEEESGNEEYSRNNHPINHPIHSPLSQEEEEEEEQDIPLLTPSTSTSTIASNSSTISSHLLHSDCKLVNNVISVI
ncbi:hypothetical protein G6F62_009164 [Rhizopus arrhizus]|nr:hypothetical protein G6F66_005684 [Rhizopus arrhizus]KAG1324313.1 hypothetical protein G6F62_009164 [Rhizopus arrhizus]KAG1378048.1 hypothetical protein G6F61_006187 [Rhizopus arrhizus]KAG1402564.1 hypothetical protein G6F60_005623 [Rhizopus arrhizus]